MCPGLFCLSLLCKMRLKKTQGEQEARNRNWEAKHYKEKKAEQELQLEPEALIAKCRN